jgi:hypothetical protein
VQATHSPPAAAIASLAVLMVAIAISAAFLQMLNRSRQ